MWLSSLLSYKNCKRNVSQTARTGGKSIMAENTTILLETAGFAISKMNTDFYNTEIR